MCFFEICTLLLCNESKSSKNEANRDFFCWKICTGGSRAGLRPICWPKVLLFFTVKAAYLHFLLLQTSPTLKCRPHIPSYLCITFDFWQDDAWPLGRRFFGPDCPKLPFLEPEIVLLCYAGTPKRHFVLTTFWDEITFGHITQWLGADFDKTHFFQRRPVYMLKLNWWEHDFVLGKSDKVQWRNGWMAARAFCPCL